jgi:excisionase family DNA binding protein
MANEIPITLMKVQQVAHYLNVSKAKVYNMIEAGEMPCYRMGKAIRVSKADLDQFISNSYSRA